MQWSTDSSTLLLVYLCHLKQATIARVVTNELHALVFFIEGFTSYN